MKILTRGGEPACHIGQVGRDGQFGDERFQDIARTVRRDATIDWHLREQARANLRRMVKGCCAGTGTRRTGGSTRAAP